MNFKDSVKLSTAVVNSYPNSNILDAIFIFPLMVLYFLCYEDIQCVARFFREVIADLKAWW